MNLQGSHIREYLVRSGQFLQRVWPLFPAALYLVGFLVLVVVYLVGLSLSWETGASVSKVREVLAMPAFQEALSNTFWFVVIGTPLELLAGLFTALLLFRAFRGQGFVRSLLIIPLAIPTLVTATILFILFDFPGGHVNDLLMGKYALFPALLSEPVNWRSGKWLALGVALAGKVWRDLPISMLILTAGLNAIDPELIDAARTMGAGFRWRLITIILPLLLPAISAVVLLRSLEMWKEFIFPFVLAGRYNLLGTLIESLYNDWGHPSEAAVVALALVVCIVVSTVLLMGIMEIIRNRFVRGQRDGRETTFGF